MMTGFANLPEELVEEIFKRMDGRCLWTCLGVNSSWRRLANQNKLWVRHCQEMGLDVDDVPFPSSISYFSLCPLAEEWYDINIKIWEWSNGEDEKREARRKKDNPNGGNYLVDDLLLLEVYGLKLLIENYRDRKMVYHEQLNSVKIFQTCYYKDRLLYDFDLTPNLVPKHDLIYGKMNSKYCVINGISYILVFKGFYNYQYYRAYGFENNDVIDISEKVTSYKQHDLTEKHNLVFDPVVQNGDKLLVPLKSYGIINVGRVLIIDLPTNTMTSLNIPFEYEKIHLTKNHFSFVSNKEAIIYDSNGNTVLKEDKHTLIHINDDYLAKYIDSKIDVYKIQSLTKVWTFPLKTKVTFMKFHAFLNYLYVFTPEGKKLCAYDVDSGTVLWRSNVDMQTNMNVTFNFSGRFLLIFKDINLGRRCMCGGYYIIDGKMCEPKTCELFYASLCEIRKSISLSRLVERRGNMYSSR